jgi:3-oxoacyl-[acyl-carrier-protein] synthase II
MPASVAKTAGRFSQFAIAAAKMARDDSHFDAAAHHPEDVKVAIGTSLNGEIDVAQPNFESFLQGGTIWPWACLEFPGHAATSHVAISAGAQGQATTFATACAAGLDAIAWAGTEVTSSNAEAAIAGATETPLSSFILKVFQSVGVLSKWQGPPEQASRPFEALRSGLVLAEGAATVVLEAEKRASSRGSPIYARLLSAASATEGRHLRKVDTRGETAAHVMALALERAKLRPADIDFICAHGNSMQDYDVAETAAIKTVFGRRAWNIPVSSLKSMCGQALAAGSAMQVVAACLALRDQIVPPTINYCATDPSCDLDYVPNVPRRARLRHVLIHAHSLGGSHVAAVLSRPD